MTRFIASTSGVLVEVAAFDTGAPAEMVGLAILGLIVTVMFWWNDATSIIDRVVGLDL